MRYQQTLRIANKIFQILIEQHLDGGWYGSVASEGLRIQHAQAFPSADEAKKVTHLIPYDYIGINNHVCDGNCPS